MLSRPRGGDKQHARLRAGRDLQGQGSEPLRGRRGPSGDTSGRGLQAEGWTQRPLDVPAPTPA